MTHAQATKELSSYESLKSAINVNKAVTGFVPLVAGGAFAHIFKVKPVDTSKHMKAIAAVTSLALLTNIYAAYSRS